MAIMSCTNNIHCSLQVISTLKDQTPVPFHEPASEEEAIYKQLSFHNPAILIPASEIR